MEKKHKIAIMGLAGYVDRLSALVNKHHNVEIISPEQAKEMNLRPEPIVFPINPPPVFDLPFQLPMTRAERRKLKRKKS